MTQFRRPRAAALAAVVTLVLGLVHVAPAAAQPVSLGDPAARAAETPSANTVTAYGVARDLGPDPSTPFADGLVGMAPTPSAQGYWLVAEDGGIFTFGDAAFHGSTGGIDLNEPIIGMAATPSGGGYWLVASDGGVFTFGDAGFYGSTGGISLNSPVTGMAPTPDGEGYWLVAEDGGIFTFGDAPFYGSMGGMELDSPVVSMTAAPNGLGYWLAARDGQVFEHGVTDHGSPAETEYEPAEAPTVAIVAAGDGGYWLVHGEPQPEPGDDEPGTAEVQQRLRELGYWVGPVDGVYGTLTEQAIYAFQKYQGLAVDGVLGPNTRQALLNAERPTARSTSGDVIEIDKTRQLLFFVRDGRVEWVFNTSTGTEEPYTYEGRTYLADTPPGFHAISWVVDGVRVSNLGRLYRPRYFHSDGIAIHGYSFVPPYPASHGCVRVTNPAIDFIWAQDLAPIGRTVWVYGTTPSV